MEVSEQTPAKRTGVTEATFARLRAWGWVSNSGRPREWWEYRKVNAPRIPNFDKERVERVA